ncbi:MAG: cobyrinate a,c-diamide synthase, partial [Lachnospiraceae bacterium]|nr:cobyrinate a,c-diamide synthase [Lachnospiraceae bacterium]
MLHLPRFMLAAPSSGSGKTMLTCGILQALKDRGCAPASYKCGPDYIDPMFHSRVLGTPSRNLDTFFTDEETTRYLFANSAKHAGISVMEGVMGLYDGVGGITDQASAYDLARVTATPVILIVNAKGMSLSLIPFLKGFVDYQRADGRVIQGVILNRATKMTSMLLKEKIEQETGLKLIGYVPELTACRVESRHLGLVTPGEIQDLQTRMEELAGELEKSLDFEALLAIAEQAEDYPDEAGCIPEKYADILQIRQNPEQKTVLSGIDTSECNDKAQNLTQNSKEESKTKTGKTRFHIRIAVAKDEAFCFYYQDNLELLELLGAELAYFSPIHDKAMPEGCSGLLIGGGYPELYAKALSENKSMLASIRQAIESGMPYLSECGGFMYLHEKMQDMQDLWYPMVGILKGESYRTPKLGRFGYITLQAKEGEQQLLAPGETIRGHEFHYFDSTDPGSDYHAEKPVTGRN